jgi:hypothetical protein
MTFELNVRRYGEAGSSFWDSNAKGVDIVLSNLGLTATQSGTVNNGSNVRSIVSRNSGIHQYDVTIIGSLAPGAQGVGFVNDVFIPGVNGGTTWVGGNPDSVAMYSDGSVFTNNSLAASLGLTFGNGDVVTAWINDSTLITSLVSWRVNGGNWNGNIANDPTVGTTTWTNNGATAYADVQFGPSPAIAVTVSNFALWN